MQFGERLRRERRRRHLSQETLSEVLGCSPKTIRRWENQQAFPQAHHKLQISRFFGIRQEEWFTEDREAIHSASLWNIPYPRNPFFTGREEILHQLNKLLHQESLMAQSRPWAVTGPGGIGKTQIVL
ncbi:MAG TPA: helix-turn-helix transcriptional regulator, partial [Ktedonobacteraceae bacterium]|nr:helix-turn-helix transcriptional regulator [Ktedonobacteraceae bacterium]